MKVENPFESGHIKNYLLLYVSVVVIVMLFFIASTLLHDVKEQKQKVFNIKPSKALTAKKAKESKSEKDYSKRSLKSQFKLMEVNY